VTDPRKNALMKRCGRAYERAYNAELNKAEICKGPIISACMARALAAEIQGARRGCPGLFALYYDNCINSASVQNALNLCDKLYPKCERRAKAAGQKAYQRCWEQGSLVPPEQLLK